ncbi:MAG TPA: nucleotide disphospho-sugar-binding domain-containing protein [Actinomycetospora sp.]|jgi:UDP:flavonoid glycosyltransferase YjiC (YdhE family)|uniref:glycosyltransferase n=1 Tax=Actinomycetospora sp. TaxID=1872135 RepID=UPI002F41C500
MARFLIATWDGGGNVAPAVAVGRELRRRGHTVRFLGHESQRASLSGAGFPVESYCGVRPFRGAEANSVPRLVSTLTDRGLGRAVLAELEARPADVVLADCLLVPVQRACADTGQRYVSLEHLFDAYLRRGWLRGPLGIIARLKGLRPVGTWDRAGLCLVAAPESLDPAAAGPVPANVRFVGPMLDLPPRHDPAGHDPAVLVSLSTFHYPGMQSALQRIIDATADLGVRVAVTTGPVIDPASLRTAPNHEVHRFVPHDALMPQVSLVVGHGGHATTMRALAHALPLVVMPMHPMLDQPLVGRAVADAGAGEVIAKKASPGEVRRVVERMLASDPHRQAAAALGEEIRRLDGTARAADLLEGIATPNSARHGSASG